MSGRDLWRPSRVCVSFVSRRYGPNFILCYIHVTSPDTVLAQFLLAAIEEIITRKRLVVISRRSETGTPVTTNSDPASLRVDVE